MTLRVGFDISQSGAGRAGCGVVAHDLARALGRTEACRLVLLPSFGGHVLDGEVWSDGGVELGPHFATVEASLDYWRAPRLEHRLDGLELDVVHANNFFAPRGLERVRLVYTLYDLSFLAHPEWSTEANRVACFDGMFTAAVEADLILAVSESSRRHFLRIFPHYPEERTAVVALGSRFEDGTIAAERPRNLEAGLEQRGFLLSVGTLEPRKNHRLLLRAFRRYSGRRAVALPLVVAGGGGWLMDGFDRDMAAQDDVHRLGYVSDEELLWLYRHCRLFVYPSRFEGFGLPVLEAMGQGAAVVASAATSLPEVVGDGGVLVEPRDEEGLAGALELAHDRERLAELSALALERAARFSWRRSAERVAELYRRVVEWPKYATPATRCG